MTDKILAVVFPVSAFVAAGFEHSIANMYLIPLGILLRDQLPAVGASGAASLNWTGFVYNLVPVTLGNIAGGALMVAGVYHLIYNKALDTELPAVKFEHGRSSQIEKSYVGLGGHWRGDDERPPEGG